VDSNGNTYSDMATIYNLTTTNNAVIDLYAQWRPAVMTFRYHSNNKTTDTVITETWKYDEVATIRTNTYTMNKSDFLGWGFDGAYSIADPYPNIDFTQGQVITNYVSTDQTFDLYAIWLEKEMIITAELSNVRRPAAETFKNGEQAKIEYNLYGWPTTVSITFPDEWNEYYKNHYGYELNITKTFNGESYKHEGLTYLFYVPIDDSIAEHGETYPIVITATNKYGYDDTYTLYLKVESSSDSSDGTGPSILDEIKDRLK
jgi:hypothetical protein